VLSLQYKVQKE